MPLLRRTVIAVLVVFVGWIAPAAPAAPADPPTRLNPRDFGARQILVVHWSRLDEAYDGWNVWAWIPGKDGRAHPLAGTDAFGRYAVIPITEPTDRVGIIVRRGEWQEKDGDGDRFVQIGAEGVREVWLVAGDAR